MSETPRKDAAMTIDIPGTVFSRWQNLFDIKTDKNVHPTEIHSIATPRRQS